MKKRTFTYILSSMAISSILAIFFQINWLRNSYKLSESNFEKSAKQALTAAVEVINAEQEKQNISIDGSTDSSWNYSAKDSLYSFTFFSLNKFNKKPNFGEPFYNVLKKLNQEFIKERIGVGKFKEDIMLLYTQNDISNKDIFEYLNIDSLITTNLKNNSIDLKYSYGFLRERDSSWLKIGGLPINDPLQLKDSKYVIKASHIPNLHVYFFDEGTVIYKKLILNIIFSTLLVFIVLSSFTYALLIIMKQKKLSQIKTDFINNMTHEFKTPLATISMATATIEEPDVIENATIVRQFTKVIKEENERMNKQLEMVLNAAKEDDILSKLNIKKIDIESILTPIIEHNKIRVSRKNGVFCYQANAKNTSFNGDYIHIYQAINNLIDNAIKYSHNELEILVSTENKNEFLVINVIDKGLGIKKEDEKLIFEKFYRVSSKDTHNVKGFGLGLNYVKQIALAHGGNVIFKNNATLGSTFSLLLPQETT